MTDKKQVIFDIERCICHVPDACRDCSKYKGVDGLRCMEELMADAYTLLKEQEAVEPFHKCIGKSFSLIQDSNYNYCPYCGKPITWEKQEGR